MRESIRGPKPQHRDLAAQLALAGAQADELVAQGAGQPARWNQRLLSIVNVRFHENYSYAGLCIAIARPAALLCANYSTCEPNMQLGIHSFLQRLYWRATPPAPARLREEEISVSVLTVA